MGYFIGYLPMAVAWSTLNKIGGRWGTIIMDPDKDNKSGNRELTPGEKLFGSIVVGWFVISVLMAIISPKIGFGLLAGGALVAAIVGLVLHAAG